MVRYRLLVVGGVIMSLFRGRMRLALMCIGLGVVSLGALLAFEGRRRSSWQYRIRPIVDMVRSFDPKTVDPLTIAVYQRLVLDILTRPTWGQADIDELLAELEWSAKIPASWAPGVRLGREPTVEEMEAHLRFIVAIGAITERLRTEAPIETGGRERLAAALARQLEHPSPSVRLSATTSVVHSGLVDEAGPLRDKIIALAQDPDPTVARNARNQLEWRDKDRRRASR